MSTKLKPLVLPQLVQDRRKQDDVHCTVEAIDTVSSMFLVDNASMSDITSPATPTFSHRSGLGHLRYSSSTSSLDLPLPLPSPSFSECPAPPAAAPGGTGAVPSTPTPVPKRPLPDVQEEDLLERVAEDEHQSIDYTFPPYRNSYLYGCLCDEPCEHGRGERNYDDHSYDYEPGSASDCEATATVTTPLSARGHRRRTTGGSVSAASDTTSSSSLSGLTLRFGSHIHALSRWRSGSSASRRTYGNLIGAPASEPSLSRAPSSRSSSLSAPRPAAGEPSTVITPTLSFYGSTESIEHITTSNNTLGVELDEARQSLERDRAKAATPLLPPLFISSPQPPASPLPPPSLQTSPLHSPTAASPAAAADPPPVFLSRNTADSGIPAMSLSSVLPVSTPTSMPVPTPTEALPSPPLSREFSTASFHHLPLVPAPPVPMPASALEPQDEWSNRLGHANYTIVPKPYRLPRGASTQALHLLRDDWARARTNYAKHLVRTGEHYGTTSNTYVLTEAKWVETEQEWKNAHSAAFTDVQSRCDMHECANLGLLPQQHDVSSVVPQILDLDGDGKFPHRGDEDIVGPMDRVAYMERDGAAVPEEKHGMTKFLRGLAGRVRMRKP